MSMDKLKPYGFPMHRCINSWSRKIHVLWPTVPKSNNHPEIIANFYLNCVADLGGCPVKLRSDCGTENDMTAAIQFTFQQDAETHKYGSSSLNQRMKGWWTFYRRNRSGWWIYFFKSLME